jgi:ferrous iron transport protein B
MLAAPILALGLPTLVILNMADDLRSRQGKLDLRKLSHELGAPVTLVSARAGEGVTEVFDFLQGAMAKPMPTLLPVLHDVPKCREWAGGVGNKAGYRPPIAPKWTRRLDSVFLHPVAGPLLFILVVVGVIRTIFMAALPLSNAAQSAITLSGNWLASVLPDRCSLRCCWTAFGRGRQRGGLPAAGAAAFPLHRDS